MRRRSVFTVAGLAAVSVPAAADASPPAGTRARVRTGMDRLAASGWDRLKGSRVGVVSNPTGVDRDYRHLVDRMHEDGVTIGGVFGPEHGFRGSAQAGGSEGTGVDARTGLTVYDAYLASLEKWMSMFTASAVRTVVFDIQDVGARFYTYIYTLYDSMAAAARLGLRYVVLDRPNPIGGRAHGPMMTDGYTSGVGRLKIVQQHGLTVGELARFYNGEFLSGAVNLEVITCTGWHGGLHASDTDVPWVLPSPNMPTPDTAEVYPGTGMVEGVSALSEGRGTTRPFELIGGPGFDHRWGDRVAAHGLPGVEFREAYFTPTFNKFTNVLCAGVEVKVTGRAGFDPIRTAVAMLVEARKEPAFSWRLDGTRHWIDLLTGSARLRTMIDAGATPAEVTGAWAAELAAFEKQRRPYLLYPRPSSPTGSGSLGARSGS
ncbi:exo-beta-N-acetylmuramidase NamZ domain-containing protein [Actinoplanes sp. NPDC048988]|uniref:exo-beta-N-acetylmuramidase NamZ family protein n=1 Tax=Actinoplanes sp. NPDC048988 TaxID=3363901 RepID=UPI00371085E4